MPGLQSLAQHSFPTCTKLIALELNALNGLPYGIFSSPLISFVFQCAIVDSLRSLIVKGIIENAKLPLLQQLKRNMPNYFVCHCCFLLHQYDGSGSLGLTCLRPNWNCPLPCIRRAQWKVGHLELDTHDDTAHIYYLFHFLHIQLAMRRFSHGPRTDLSKPPTPGLCLRIQGMMFVKQGKGVLTLRSNCDKCKTDFELAIQEHGGNIALLITRWINLGSGLTPDDLQWKAHTYNGLSKEPDTPV
ncbi:hypothetical protein N7536_005169 [Penicillium majusculum]|nr:hypothetical protein N7536_005169 [Penicillium majusculum]